MDYFTLFGLPARYQLDTQALSLRFQDLQRQYHPDKFASGSQAEQLAAVQQSATINQAWQTLRHPLMRAEYLLSLHGFDLASEQHYCARHRVPDGTVGAARRAGRDRTGER
ncbi:co-chaperone HscB [Escherichia coli]|uniref:Co-chaperone protein HscB n=1 Tax=Escherichia coli TaxID=562 RepID=A0A2X1KHE5_ECOLX|nr:co-chaperone HscB [Escherichia coli]